jgi:leucyl/phenylalanyl-tRNA--protein transferase
VFLRPSLDVRDDPLDILWHYANGWLPFSLDDAAPLSWQKYTHRGMQPLDRIHIGDKQKRDVFNKRFELRFDAAFEEVIRACADPSRHGNWITETYIRGMIRLFRMGFARSYECWEGGRLVGGCFGVHIGSYVSIDSMFHHAPNASKAAYVRALVHLRERGFEWMDINFVSDHLARWGAEWMPSWKFEGMLAEMVSRPLRISDEIPALALPLPMRAAMPIVRVGRALLRRAGLLDFQKSKEIARPASNTPAADAPAAAARLLSADTPLGVKPLLAADVQAASSSNPVRSPQRTRR